LVEPGGFAASLSFDQKESSKKRPNAEANLSPRITEKPSAEGFIFPLRSADHQR
jgi:hypothetical protein